MDISEPESDELSIGDPPIEQTDAEFEDIDMLVLDIITSDPSAVEKLAVRLTDQLVQFQGCCHDCHNRSEMEHTGEQDTHFSLQDCVTDSAAINCPQVLGTFGIAAHKDEIASRMTVAEKRQVYSGIYPGDPEEIPRHICLAKGDTPTDPPDVSFDVDSIVGFPTSLGFARWGIRWNPTQMQVSDLQSGLHLPPQRIQFFDSHGHFHSQRQPIHKVPHYTIGRLVGFEDASLYILFPRLYREGQQSSRLVESDFEAWMDRVLLPAIYKHYRSSQTQHYPSSYRHSKYNSTARGVEGRSQKTDNMPREQLLMHFIQPDQLYHMWETILETVEQPGLEQFKGIKLFLDTKNLKGLTKGYTWAGMITRFQSFWQSAVNETYMSREIYFDIGKETCPTATYLAEQAAIGQPEVLIWKRCCLDSYYQWCQDEKGSLRTPIQYPTAMLQDSCAMGIETKENSELRRAGLLYSQFYPSLKEIFAAGNIYPFANTAIETLTLDPKLQKTWQHVGGALSHNPIALIKAYLYAKARCHYGLLGSMQKSFGVREEHRISRELFMAIDQQFRLRNCHQIAISPAGDELPYFTHLTTAILSWHRWNINKFCLGFEMVYSLSGSHWVTWEHTQVMLMFLRCLRFSYGSAHPQESAGCWRDVTYKAIGGAQPRRGEGLGFEVTMRQYGHAWFLEKIDWDTLTFQSLHAPYMLFNNPSMQMAYHAQYRQVRDVHKDFITIDKIRQLMQQFEEVAQCQEFLEIVLVQICLCAFRKDVFQHIRHLLKKSCVEDAIAGQVPLCWPSVNRVLRHRPAHLVTGKRLAVQSIEVLFVWLWEWKDGPFQRRSWEDKPYRLLYQRSYEIIRLVHGKERARGWKQKLKGTFIRSHWLLPYPQGNRFMKRQGSGDQQQVCWWSSYHAGVHRYYQAQAQEPRLEPLPASDATHYPLNGWRLSHSATEYMPYDIWPEDDLVQLSDADIFEQAEQLAAEGQLLEEVGQLEDRVASAVSHVEIYSIEERQRTTRQTSRVEQAWEELEAEQERQAAVEYRGRHIEADEETSDEERLEAIQRRQRKVVAQKEAELEQLRAEEAEERRQREVEEAERRQAQARRWAATKAREQRREINRIRRLQHEQLERLAERRLQSASKQWSKARKRRTILGELFSSGLE